MTEVELERRRRIRLSLAAYAYEFENTSIMSDHDFDALSKLVDLNTSTGNETLDAFFKREFEPSTGMWVRRHPELPRLRSLYHTLYKQETP